MQSAVDAGKSGDVVLSKEAQLQVRSFFVLTELDSGDFLVER